MRLANMHPIVADVVELVVIELASDNVADAGVCSVAAPADAVAGAC